MRDYEAARVEALVGQGSRRAAVGLDETLARLQDGRVRELVIARGIGGTVRQCERCGRADRSADPVCPSCGGARHVVPVRVAIPDLARRHGVPVEVVAGRAARTLRDAGGVGAWLGLPDSRRPRRGA